MPKKKRKSKKSPPTVITLTLPDEGGIQREGTLLIQCGEIAKLTTFHYCNASDIAAAIRDAQASFTETERQPPVIAEPEPADDSPTTPGVCAACNGSGQVTTISQIAGQRVETSGVCLDCDGSGRAESESSDKPEMPQQNTLFD